MIAVIIYQTTLGVNVSEDGFIIERDTYFWNEDVYFSTDDKWNAKLNYTFKYPKNISTNDERYEYIENFVNNTYLSAK